MALTGNTSKEDVDHRQVVYVYLVSQHRQKYFKFYCTYCGQIVAHLEADKVLTLSDVADTSYLPDAQRLKVRCNGPYCRTWYEFLLNS